MFLNRVIDQLVDAEFYHSSCNYKELFDGHVKACSESTDHFSPSFAILQSSGMGKTKLCLEYLKSHLGFYIYCGGALGYESECFKFLSSLGGCEESSICKSESVLRCIVFFKYSMIHLWRNLQSKQLNEDDIKAFSVKFFPHTTEIVTRGSYDFWMSVLDSVNEFVHCRQKYNDALDIKKSSADNVSQIDSRISAFESWEANFENEWINVKQWIDGKGIKPILFVIDEAKLLTTTSNGLGVSAFRIVRRSAADISLHGYICVCFVGTSAKLANFAPTDKKDQSGRVVMEKLTLFPPFVAFAPGDCKLSPEECLPGEAFHEWILSRDKNPLSLVKMGRPLWYAHYQAEYSASVPRSSTNAFLKVLKFAQQKIFLLAENENLMAAQLALFLCRLPLTVSPTESIADVLVASNMAYCQYISQERDRLFSSYLSEPILAAAAAKVLQEDILAANAITALSQSFAYGKISVGYFGELVAAFILLGACDEACLEQGVTPLHSVSLKAWIKTMFGTTFWSTAMETLAKELKKSEEDLLPNGVVAFNHIVRLMETMDKNDIRRGIERVYAIWGCSYQRAFDFCIPVALENGHLTAVYVQVKNHKDRFSDSQTEAIFAKMIEIARTHFSDISKCIFILLSFDQGLKTPSLKMLILDGCLCLSSNGFSELLFPNILGKRGINAYGIIAGLLYGELNLYSSIMAIDKPHFASTAKYGKAVLENPFLTLYKNLNIE